MLVFAAAVFFLIITPGPGVLSIAGVGSAFGARAGIHFLIGLFVGTNLVALAVVTGLAAAILAEPRLKTILFYISVAYLLYLAVRIAFSGSKVAFIKRAKPPGFLGGLMLQAVNPKAYVVNTSLFSGFAFMASQPLFETALKFLIINAIWVPIHMLWLGAGMSLQKLDLASHVQFRINIVMALFMLAVVALASWSQT